MSLRAALLRLMGRGAASAVDEIAPPAAPSLRQALSEHTPRQTLDASNRQGALSPTQQRILETATTPQEREAMLARFRSGAAHQRLVAAIRDPATGEVFTDPRGHAAAFEKIPMRDENTARSGTPLDLLADGGANSGFVTAEGQFLTRPEAVAWADQQALRTPSPGPEAPQVRTSEGPGSLPANDGAGDWQRPVDYDPYASIRDSDMPRIRGELSAALRSVGAYRGGEVLSRVQALSDELAIRAWRVLNENGPRDLHNFVLGKTRNTPLARQMRGETGEVVPLSPPEAPQGRMGERPSSASDGNASLKALAIGLPAGGLTLRELLREQYGL